MNKILLIATGLACFISCIQKNNKHVVFASDNPA